MDTSYGARNLCCHDLWNRLNAFSKSFLKYLVREKIKKMQALCKGFCLTGHLGFFSCELTGGEKVTL